MILVMHVVLDWERVARYEGRVGSSSSVPSDRNRFNIPRLVREDNNYNSDACCAGLREGGQVGGEGGLILFSSFRQEQVQHPLLVRRKNDLFTLLRKQTNKQQTNQ
jgi:hypothetical protein